LGFGTGASEKQVVVPVDVPPLQVTYHAGWNLVGAPAGTNLVGTLGPLDYLPWPPSCAAAGPSSTPVPIFSPGRGTVFMPPPGCTDAYVTLPADAAVDGFGPGDSVPVVGQGYWAFFPRQTMVLLPFRRDFPSIILPGGRYLMMANPSFRPVTVQGADVVYVYDATTRSYVKTTTLQPGQGAWACAALTGELHFVEQTK
jgi:hypothetical protein